VLTATVLALVAALLHAAWNLVAKRSADVFIALWGQFVVAGVIGLVVVVSTGGIPAEGWIWAVGSGLVHVPYLAGLARAYAVGDFSLAYPMARGGGALLAGIGGLVFLDDDLSIWSVLSILTVAAGMALLSAGADRVEVAFALFVAVTIGTYTLLDSQGSRTVDDPTYAFASFLAIGVTVSIYGIVRGGRRELVTSLRTAWRQYAMTGAMSVTAYALVMAAVRKAPVGYVAALRESSVLVAAFIGWRYLGEHDARRRLVAASIIVAGLVALVVSA
jgi:drug/metabolite transporter (DMT)-like permease